MTNADQIVNYLKSTNTQICDDCLSLKLNIHPRQQVYQLCTKLAKQDIIREKGSCKYCGRIKNISFMCHPNAMRDIEGTANRTHVHQEAILELPHPTILLNIIFKEADLESLFKLLTKKTLLQVVHSPRYSKFIALLKEFPIESDMPIGEFLSLLTTRNDARYLSFLNAYGDLKYCNFTVYSKCKDSLKTKGLYFFCINEEMKYIGMTTDSFNKRINTVYGKILPRNCYLDGQSTNCRINNLVNECRTNIQIYIMPLDNDEEISRLEKLFINRYRPEWNIQQ